MKDRLVETIFVERAALTEPAAVRPLRLLRRDARGDTSALPRRTVEDVLDPSAFVPSREVVPDVVTIPSQVLLKDLQTGQRITLTLRYPAASGFASTLSSIGSALLGLRVGSVARRSGPSGGEGADDISAMPYQPKPRGDHAM